MKETKKRLNFQRFVSRNFSFMLSSDILISSNCWSLIVISYFSFWKHSFLSGKFSSYHNICGLKFNFYSKCDLYSVLSHYNLIYKALGRLDLSKFAFHKSLKWMSKVVWLLSGHSKGRRMISISFHLTTSYHKEHIDNLLINDRLRNSLW